MLFNSVGLKSRNLNVIGFSSFISGFLFFIPILALYLQRELLTITNVAILLALTSLTSLLLDIPTGAFADLYARKTSLLIGQMLILISVFILAIAKGFPMFALFAVIWGAGQAFMSGTAGSIIYDTLKQEKKEKHFKKVNGIFQAIWPFGASIGFILGGYLAKYSLTLPIYLSLIPLAISIIISFFVIEPKYHREKHSIFKQMHSSIKFILSNKQLIILISASLLLMAFGESSHQLKPIFFAYKHIPIQYFGWIFGAVSALSALGFYFSHRFSERFGNKFLLALGTLIVSISIVLAVFTDGWLSIFFLVMNSFLYGLRGPIMAHFIHVEVESSKRATILSATSFAESLGMAAIAPVLGYFADLWSINTAYLIVGIVYLVPTILFMLIRDRK